MAEKKDIAVRALFAINRILERDNITQTALAARLGSKPAKFTEILKGRMLVPTEMMAELCEGFNVSATWLLTGEGNTFNKPEELPDGAIPLLSIEAVAGPGVPVYNDLPIEDYYAVREFRNCDFLIRVTGDSMTPKFTGGDIVACKNVDVRQLKFLQWGRVYVLYTESQGVMIKRVHPSESDDCIKCVSENKDYAPFDVPKSDIVALALVNGSISLE